MTPEELDAILDRALKATRGPWLPDTEVNDWVVEDLRQVGIFVRFYQRSGLLNHVAFVDARRVGHDEGSVRPVADANFIAHAREDVPALVGEVKRLQARLKLLEAWIDLIESQKPTREPD